MTNGVKQEIFGFLNVLRDSGAMNMLGAAPVIAEEFGLPMTEARKVFDEWAKSFKEVIA
jgi:hypothetical protein